MERYKVVCEKKPLVLTVPISAPKGANVFIVGYHPYRRNTEYFTRHIEVKGQETIEFNCPTTPNHMSVIAWSENGDSFSIPKIDKRPLARNVSFIGNKLPPDLKFIELFANRCGYMSDRRFYYHPDAKFRIQFLPVIYNDSGKAHTTPARIHVSKPLIQVSKRHFDAMSIPQRVAILAHEYAHNFLNIDQDSEFEADENMVEIYEGLGYGNLEAIYAFANVMGDNDVNYQRLLNIDQKLNATY